LSDQSSQDESDLPEQLFGKRVIVIVEDTVAILTLDDVLREMEEELDG
jgi:hypothetical protein